MQWRKDTVFTLEKAGKKWQADDYGHYFDMAGNEVHPETLEPLKNVFICDECGKRFDYKISLAGHKRSHKKEVVK